MMSKELGLQIKALIAMYRATNADDLGAALEPLFVNIHRIADKLESASAWQPIESAPKDGTEFIAYDAGWSETGIEIVKFDESDVFFILNDRVRAAFTPTHWQPLPSAPKEDA